MLCQVGLGSFRLVSVFILFLLVVVFLGFVLLDLIEFWEIASSTLSENKLSELGCVELARRCLTCSRDLIFDLGVFHDKNLGLGHAVGLLDRV